MGRSDSVPAGAGRPEAFGLVRIDAMACGTPVIAWRRGSVPEVVDDGVTGIIVDSVEDRRL